MVMTAMISRSDGRNEARRDKASGWARRGLW